MAAKRVLLVDDEKSFLLSLEEGLKLYAPWLQIHTASDGEEALGILGRNKVDLLVTDLRMPGMDGFELLERLDGGFSGPVLVISAHIGGEVRKRLERLGVKGAIEKPFELEEFAERILSELEFALEREDFSLDLFFSSVDSFLKKVFGKGREVSCSK